jgi:O-methyltransferase
MAIEQGANVRATEEQTEARTAEERYLDLLKLCLMGLAVYEPHSHIPGIPAPIPLPEANFPARRAGADWPQEGFTMIGEKRLDNIQMCVSDVLANDVPGDFIETGVWRGGSMIFLRALLALHGVTNRTVFVADSFEGLPAPDPEQYPADADCVGHLVDHLSVPLETVQANFRRFGLLDDQVRFVKGWFSDTLPTLADRTWAVVRLDGDMYESTMVGLESLYQGLSSGGYLIIDDYMLDACREAVHDFREANGISEPIEVVDPTGVYWKKQQ